MAPTVAPPGAGAFVIMAAPAANAATLNTSYTCTFPVLGAQPVGKNKIKLSYVGDDFTAPGKSKVIVRVIA